MNNARASMLRSLLAATGLSLCIGHVQAQTSPLEFKFASSAPPTSPWAKQIERLAAQVAEETKGGVKIVPFFGSQLGSENEVIAQISRGRLDMGLFTTSAVALQIPEISLLQLPFFFSSSAQRDCVLDNHVRKHTADALAKKNLVFISWGEFGPVHLPGKRSYATPTDIKGIKVGTVANRMTTDFWRAMGTNPVPTNIAEATSSSQTGLIDTFPSPLAFYVPSGLNKVLPTLTRIHMSDAGGVFLMNKALYDKMPAQMRTGFDAGAGKTPVATLRAEIRAVDAALTTSHKQAGGAVVDTTPEQRAEWSKNLGPVWLAIAKDIGAEGERFLALMDAGKKACEK